MKAALQIQNKGFTLTELVVAIGSLGIVVLAIAQFSQLFLRGERLASQKTQSAFLLQEGAEAVRYLRDASWSGNIAPLSTSTQYFLVFNGDYTLTETEPALLNGTFRRTISVSDVFRDANDDIAQTGAFDPETKHFTISTAWRRGSATTTDTLEFLMADLFHQ